jgi:hypothetical protein
VTAGEGAALVTEEPGVIISRATAAFNSTIGLGPRA